MSILDILFPDRRRKEDMKLRGEVTFRHIRNGEIIDERTYKNVIVNTGKAQVAGLINGATTGPFQYIAIGTGTTSESASDTSLVNETHRGQDTSPSRETTNVSNDTAVLDYTFDFTSSYAITESGVFNASSGGTMLCRKTFSAINVANGDSLQVTWKITVS